MGKNLEAGTEDLVLTILASGKAASNETKKGPKKRQMPENDSDDLYPNKKPSSRRIGR